MQMTKLWKKKGRRIQAALTGGLAWNIYITPKEAWLNTVVSNDLGDIINCSYGCNKWRQ